MLSSRPFSIASRIASPTCHPFFPLQLELLFTSQSFCLILVTIFLLLWRQKSYLLNLAFKILHDSAPACHSGLVCHLPPLHPFTLMLQLKQSFQFLTHPANTPPAVHLECFLVLPAYVFHVSAYRLPPLPHTLATTCPSPKVRLAPPELSQLHVLFTAVQTACFIHFPHQPLKAGITSYSLVWPAYTKHFLN